MARFEHNEMILWYGTEDAPAPADAVAGGASQSVIIGIQPPDASHHLQVRFRVNGGPVETITANWLRNDLARRAQYYKAQLPTFRAGDVVEYSVVCHCAGKQVPSPEETQGFASSFRVMGNQELPVPEIAMKEHAFFRQPMPEDVRERIEPSGMAVPSLREPPTNGKELEGIFLTPTMAEPALGTMRPNVIVEPQPELKLSEFEQLAAKLTPNLKNGPLGNLKDEDLALLRRQTDIEPQRLESLVQAEKLSQETGLPPEVFYGFARQGLALNLDRLLGQGVDTLRDAIETSVKNDIVPSALAESVGEISERLEKLKHERTPIRELASAFHLELPPSLLTQLSHHNIHTLVDIRNAGGLSHLAGLSIAPEDPVVRKLEAHAQLSVLPTEPAINARLIEAGYTSLQEIAETPQAAFVAAVEGRLNKDKAAALHVAATVQSLFLSNIITGLHLYSDGSTQQKADVLSKMCNCPDCRNALSPMAYLVDLLNYAIQHLKQNGNLVTLTALQNRFGQPFRDLPNACEQMEKQIPQVRICIEVLRKFLPAQYAMHTPQGYLEAAYLRLLEQIGTSFDEIRQVRSAAQDQRKQLADRLMVELDSQGNRPDRLDEFFRNPYPDFQSPLPEDLDETWLMKFFGLRDSRLGPLDSESVPWLQTWQLQCLHHSWEAQDKSSAPPLAGRPVIDPDLINKDDLLNTTPDTKPRQSRPQSKWTALDFLEDRAKWVEDRTADLDETRKNGNLEQLLEQLAKRNVLEMKDITVPELRKHRRRQQAGEDISAWLEKVKLEMHEFDYLTYIVELDARNQLILVTEWNDFYATIIQRAKRLVFFPTWLQEERQAGIMLTPNQFKIRTTPFKVGHALPSNPWRFDEAARKRWDDTLRARVEQEQAVINGLRQAVRVVEERLLVEVRNTLIGQPLPSNIVPLRKFQWLTDHLQIDMQAAVCQRTTRVAQAIETIQGVLFGARHGLLQDDTLTLDAPSFDEEWKWIGSYATWKAAMQVFLYPETALRPTLRREQSAGFIDFVERLRQQESLTPELARNEAQRYVAYFTDVCTLIRAGLYQTEAPIGNNAAGQNALAIASAGLSGRLYYSSWRLLPGWGMMGSPSQTHWQPVPGLQQASTLLGLLVYQHESRKPHVALYASGQRNGAKAIFAADYDGSTFRTGTPLDELPSLVRAAEYSEGIIPPSPRYAALGGQPWRLRPDDQLAPLDVDNNGRTELIILALTPEQSGQRRFGLLRERDGGLVLDWAEEGIPGGWRFPDPRRPVRLPKGLLVVDPTNTQGAQIGILGWINGRLEFLGATRIVTGPTGSWQVNLGASNDPTIFIAANIDGTGPKLLVFEQKPGRPPRQYQSRTTINIIEWANARLTLIATQDVQVSRQDMRCNSPCAILSKFGLQSAVSEPREDVIICIKRTDQHQRTNPYNNSIEISYEDRYSFKLLRWDSQTQQFSANQQYDYESVTSLNTTFGNWVPHADDQFLAISRNGAGERQDICVYSPSQRTLALLVYESVNVLKVAWQKQSSLVPASFGGLSWNLKERDELIPLALSGDGQQELVSIHGDVGEIGVLEVRGDRSIVVRDVVLGNKVPSPAALGTEGWRLVPNTDYYVGDLDNDGYEELVALARDGRGVARLGVLRGIPGPLPRRFLSESLPVRFGPIGVTLFELDEQPMDGKRSVRQVQIVDAYKANQQPGLEQNLTYLDEAYYFVPAELALRLREAGYYTSALDWLRLLYDYDRPLNERKIAYKLVLNGQAMSGVERNAAWLRDPLNPHALAETRRDSYCRFTISAIVRCLLDYADVEFTRATIESVPRARELYLQALELLDAPEMAQRMMGCSDLIDKLELKVGEPESISSILMKLLQISNMDTLVSTVETIEPILLSNASWPERIQQTEAIVAKAIDASSSVKTLEAVLKKKTHDMRSAATLALADPLIAWEAAHLGRNGAEAKIPYVPTPIYQFCILPNPLVETARRHAELNLRKIRNCRNIAGLEMHMEPYAAPVYVPNLADFGTGDLLPLVRTSSLQPLPYRYSTLIERAKQLIELARQIEASMLASIESGERARYEIIKARQDLALSQAGVRLKNLQLVEAGDQVGQAQLQHDRAQIQERHYRLLIANGLTFNEQAALYLYGAAGFLQLAGAIAGGGGGGGSSAGSNGTASGGAGASAGGFGAGAAGGAASSGGQFFQAMASYERREQDWKFLKALADQDILIGQQQIRQAQDRVNITTQERDIALMQTEHAETILNFLNAKFGGPALYEWMSGVLEQVYRFFLQQATVMAQLAEMQLAFERQEQPPAFIKPDYWKPPAKGMTTDFSLPGVDGPAPNLRGLTGSARLLRDLYELDQYAFRTNQRKLQLTETISLAQLDPSAFLRFRGTGVLPFATTMSLFDRKFPGHYLRLIRRVRTSVIALIPPTQGIRATLATTGTSRVVIGGTSFQKVSIQRGPESVALTSPINATGLFELDPQPELLVPFEGIGVETTWEFRMPKAANQFDYNSIADVLITIEYTALNSYDYQQQVLETMDRRFSADRAFSFRNEFADQWYDLHNPELLEEAQQMVVRFRTEREDFPPNLEDLSIQQVVLYFANQDGTKVPIENVNLQYTPDVPDSAGNQTQVGGDAKPIDGKISTRANAWNDLLGQLLPGEWVVSLRPVDTDPQKTQKLEKIIEWFKSEKKGEKCEDMLFVITYSGRTPEWPV